MKVEQYGPHKEHKTLEHYIDLSPNIEKATNVFCMTGFENPVSIVAMSDTNFMVYLWFVMM